MVIRVRFVYGVCSWLRKWKKQSDGQRVRRVLLLRGYPRPRIDG